MLQLPSHHHICESATQTIDFINFKLTTLHDDYHIKGNGVLYKTYTLTDIKLKAKHVVVRRHRNLCHSFLFPPYRFVVN